MNILLTLIALIFSSTSLTASPHQQIDADDLAKQKKIYVEAKGSPAQWEKVARHLRDVANMEKIPQVYDQGFSHCRQQLDLFAMHQSMAGEIMNKGLKTVVASPQNHPEYATRHQRFQDLQAHAFEEEPNSRNPEICLAAASAAIDLAEIEANPLAKNFLYIHSVFQHYLARTALVVSFKSLIGEKFHQEGFSTWKYEQFFQCLEKIGHMIEDPKLSPFKRYGLAALGRTVSNFYAYKQSELSKINKNQRKGKKKRAQSLPKSKDQKSQLIALTDLLMKQAMRLREIGQNTEALYWEFNEIIMSTEALEIGLQESQTRIFGQKININAPELMRNIDFAQSVISSVSPVLSYEIAPLKRLTFNNLYVLCGQLYKSKYAHLSDETKFLYFTQLMRGIKEKWVEIAESNQSVMNTTYIDLAFFAAAVAPDLDTEHEYIAIAFSHLPQIPEDENPVEFYRQISEDPQAVLSNRQQTEIAHLTTSSIMHSVLLHVSILQKMGHNEEAQRIIERLQTDNKQKSQTKKKKKMSHQAIVNTILAEQKAYQDLEERLALEKQLLEAKKSEARETSESDNKQSYWHNLSVQAEADRNFGQELTSSQKSILQDLRNIEQKRSEKAAKQAEKREDVPQTAEDSKQPPPEEGVCKTYFIPETIRKGLIAYRETFEALFETHGSDHEFNNNVSIKRDDFLRLISAIGGKCDVENGKGSHRFVSLSILDPQTGKNQILDIDALDTKLAYTLQRQTAKYHSMGTMTLSWPKKDRGHNRRFLLPEQVKNARLVLAANGLVPNLVFAKNGALFEEN